MSEKMWQILNWNDVYENAKSRTVDNKSYSSIPNKQDGLGYLRLMQMDDGCAMYGCFVATILLLSKQPRSSRDGFLTDTGRPDGIPLTPEDIELVTKCPAEMVSKMLDAVSSSRIGWATTRTPGEHTGDTMGIPWGYHGDTADPSGRPMKEGGEGLDGKEGEGTLPPLPPSLLSNSKIQETWDRLLKHWQEKKKQITPTMAQSIIESFEKWGPDLAVATMELTIERGWVQLFPEKVKGADGMKLETDKAVMAYAKIWFNMKSGDGLFDHERDDFFRKVRDAIGKDGPARVKAEYVRMKRAAKGKVK